MRARRPFEDTGRCPAFLRARASQQRKVFNELESPSCIRMELLRGYDMSKTRGSGMVLDVNMLTRAGTSMSNSPLLGFNAPKFDRNVA